jgi:hypothetical protein
MGRKTIVRRILELKFREIDLWDDLNKMVCPGTEIHQKRDEGLWEER